MRMRVRLSRAHYPVTALGPGVRIGIWVQGCSIGCPGCCSRDTWPADESRALPLEHLLAWCAEVAARGLDGITISGGEPFDQPEALHALLVALDDLRGSGPRPVDVLCYSGYPYARLQVEHSSILERLDALISEPFVAAEPDGEIWRGSANQRLITLTSMGERRYARYRDHDPQRRPVQVAVGDDQIWFIGVPRRGDMEHAARRGQELGLVQRSVSWTT